MRYAFLLLVLGLGLITSAVAVQARRRDRLEHEHRSLVELQRRLDVATDSLRRATTALDSAAAEQLVVDRTYWLGRRAYHVPPLDERVANWWTLTGPGTILALLGTLLSLAGATRIFRR